ncbi:Gldg family protein [Sphingobacterium thalpophilum]|uniref:Gldg family protein n=1 Tax=Sphingobacterium thalpophilum TaxID=259 RepID=UPI003DA52D17
MKLTLKIAQAELRNLFYSPVAWFISIAFLVQCAVFYTRKVEELAKYQEVLITNNALFKGWGQSVTKMIFLSTDGIFDNVFNNLYLFLPLLTMGLISREMNTGTMKLLLSSPVKIWEIVLGKFFAVLFYNMLLMAVLGIFMLSGLWSIKAVDMGLVLSALLAFYLLVNALSAIGLFMSSLSSYQIVSAVATFIIILILSRIGGVWQQYDLVRDLTYFLSINGRTDKMIAGLITTKDVFYFLLIVTMFISFAIFKLKELVENLPWHKRVLRYGAVVGIVLILGYISSRPGWIGYWDTTRDQLNTIHPNTQAVMQDFEPGEPVKVTLYVNLLGDGFDRAAFEARNEYRWSMWEKYVRFKPDIQFDYVYYYDVKDDDKSLYFQYPGKTLDEIAAITAEAANQDISRFQKPADVRKSIDLQPEGMRVVMQIAYKGRKTFLRTFTDAEFWPDEKVVSAAFKRVQQQTMPRILYSTGNLERSIYKTGERDFFLHAKNIGSRLSLINLGFDTDSIDLDKQEIPKAIAALVIADPKTTLSAVKQKRITEYLEKGGNAFLLGEPGKQDILNPILATIGAQFSPGTLVEVTPDEMPHMVLPMHAFRAYQIADEFYDQRQQLGNAKLRDTLALLMPGVMEVVQTNTDKGFVETPIYHTQPRRNAFIKQGTLVTDSVPPKFEPKQGDVKKASFNTLIGLSRSINQHEQRILVAGDTDFLSTVRSGGGPLTVALFSWLNDNRFPIYTPRNNPKDTYLNISASMAELQTWMLLYILPVAAMLLGSIILIRRKRK